MDDLSLLEVVKEEGSGVEDDSDPEGRHGGANIEGELSHANSEWIARKEIHCIIRIKDNCPLPPLSLSVSNT